MYENISTSFHTQTHTRREPSQFHIRHIWFHFFSILFHLYYSDDRIVYNRQWIMQMRKIASQYLPFFVICFIHQMKTVSTMYTAGNMTTGVRGRAFSYLSTSLHFIYLQAIYCVWFENLFCCRTKNVYLNWICTKNGVSEKKIVGTLFTLCWKQGRPSRVIH